MDLENEIEIDEENLEELYSWVDKTPLSRSKKNIARDFSDGVLVAEIVDYHIPHMVDKHNYTGVNSKTKKEANWDVLNQKVFKKFGIQVAKDVIKQIVNCKPYAIELFLMTLRTKIERYKFEQRNAAPQQPVEEPTRGNYKGHSPTREFAGGRNSDQGHASPGRGPGVGARKGDSQNNLHRVGPGPTSYDYKKVPAAGGGAAKGALRGGEMVPKLSVVEKEQEILAKEETIQILQAKVRRLEHLLHLKDIRITDLQSEMDSMSKKLRPTNIRH